MAKKTKTQPKARKTISSNNLADLSKLVKELAQDDENPENQQKLSALDKKIIYNEFQNSTYTLVSPMAYLIGIDKENFGEENARPFLLKSYEELDAHKEARIIRNAIDKCGCNIVFSSSPGMYSLNAARTVSECTNMWRISNDFWDSWKALDEQFDLLTKWLPYMSEGHYPDADMIPIGRLSVRSNSEWNKPRMTNFTQNEQYFLMSLWCIARSPLILGCDMPGMDDVTRSLLTNDYALDVNQHSNGTRMIFRRGGIGAWACDTQEGACVGLFNLENETRAASITLAEAGLTGKFDATDAWKERHIMNDGEMLCVKLGAHEGTLIRLKRE